MVLRISIVVAGLVGLLTMPAWGVGVLEDFETGYTDGIHLRDHADWYGRAGKDPVVQSGQGLGGSMGLSPGNKNFHWTAQSWDWASTPGVVIQMDFESASAGDPNFPFDDDRVGWTIDPQGESSSDFFQIELDNDVIRGRWKDDGDTETADIVALPTIQADTFYRFRAEFTKLTATSVSIDVSLQELDANGNPGAIVVNGSVADTSVELGDWGETPPAELFAGTLSPTFKCYDSKAPANADNAYFEVVPEPASALLVGMGVVLFVRKRRHN